MAVIAKHVFSVDPLNSPRHQPPTDRTDRPTDVDIDFFFLQFALIVFVEINSVLGFRTYIYSAKFSFLPFTSFLIESQDFIYEINIK